MRIKNEDLDFNRAPEGVRRAFLSGVAEKRLLGIGHALYKFTQHALFRPDGAATPWWSSVEPLHANDPGLVGSLERASGLGVAGADFARARTAVTRQWNRMDGLVRARLIVPVYAFAGRCAHQRFDESLELSNVHFIGGAWQLWVPNLTRVEIRED